MIPIYPVAPGISRDEITKWSCGMAINIPDKYIDFMCLHNGGSPEPGRGEFSFGEKETRRNSMIRYFYSFCENPYRNIKIAERIRGKLLPNELLPIALDPGGNVICMKIGPMGGDAGPGETYYFNRSSLQGELAQYGRHLWPIRNSFTEFIDALT